MKTSIRIFVALLVIFASAMTTSYAQAQPPMSAWEMIGTMRTGRAPMRGSYRTGSRSYGYGYYDPATIQQMISMPDGLASCQVDFNTASVTSCRSVIKTADAINMYAQNPDGILGSIHIDKGAMHFRPFDDTNARITTMTGGGLAGVGGAAIGGAFGGRKGATIAGVGGAIIGGILGSRKTHDNCLKGNAHVAQSVGLAEATTTETSTTRSTPATTKNGLSVRNDSAETAIVYDGDEAITTLAPGASASVNKPKEGFRAIVERFNERGSVEPFELGRRAEGSTLIFVSEGQRLTSGQ